VTDIEFDVDDWTTLSPLRVTDEITGATGAGSNT
jgi:hypothetical protein